MFVDFSLRWNCPYKIAYYFSTYNDVSEACVMFFFIFSSVQQLTNLTIIDLNLDFFVGSYLKDVWSSKQKW